MYDCDMSVSSKLCIGFEFVYLNYMQHTHTLHSIANANTILVENPPWRIDKSLVIQNNFELTMLNIVSSIPQTESHDIRILCIHHRITSPRLRNYACHMDIIGNTLPIPTIFSTMTSPTPINTSVNSLLDK